MKQHSKHEALGVILRHAIMENRFLIGTLLEDIDWKSFVLAEFDIGEIPPPKTRIQYDNECGC